VLNFWAIPGSIGASRGRGQVDDRKGDRGKADDGAIVDSLGWGLIAWANYDKAVAELGAPAELDAADPDVNNHLGDAYWQVGRKTEARFQWARVLTSRRDAKLRAEAEAKAQVRPSPIGQIAEASLPVSK